MFSTHTNVALRFDPVYDVLQLGSVTTSCLSLKKEKKERETLTEMTGTCYMDCKKSKVVLISSGDFL